MGGFNFNLPGLNLNARDIQEGVARLQRAGQLPVQQPIPQTVAPIAAATPARVNTGALPARDFAPNVPGAGTAFDPTTMTSTPSIPPAAQEFAPFEPVFTGTAALEFTGERDFDSIIQDARDQQSSTQFQQYLREQKAAGNPQYQDWIYGLPGGKPGVIEVGVNDEGTRGEFYEVIPYSTPEEYRAAYNKWRSTPRPPESWRDQRSGFGLKEILSIAASIAIPVAAPAIAGALATSTGIAALGGTAGAALTGAALGAGKAAAFDEDIGTGALLGGVSGGVAGALQGAGAAGGAAAGGPQPLTMAELVGGTSPAAGTVNIGAGLPGGSLAAAAPSITAGAPLTAANVFGGAPGATGGLNVGLVDTLTQQAAANLTGAAAAGAPLTAVAPGAVNLGAGLAPDIAAALPGPATTTLAPLAPTGTQTFVEPTSAIDITAGAGTAPGVDAGAVDITAGLPGGDLTGGLPVVDPNAPLTPAVLGGGAAAGGVNITAGLPGGSLTGGLPGVDIATGITPAFVGAGGATGGMNTALVDQLTQQATDNLVGTATGVDTIAGGGGGIGTSLGGGGAAGGAGAGGGAGTGTTAGGAGTGTTAGGAGAGGAGSGAIEEIVVTGQMPSGLDTGLVGPVVAGGALGGGAAVLAGGGGGGAGGSEGTGTDGTGTDGTGTDGTGAGGAVAGGAAGGAAAGGIGEYLGNVGEGLVSGVAEALSAENIADLILRGAGALAIDALSGGGDGGASALAGLSAEEQALVLEMRNELADLREQNANLFNQRLQQAYALIGDVDYFDPEYFGLQSARRAQLQAARAKQAGLRGLTGEERAAEERRFDLETGRSAGTAYDVGYGTGLEARTRARQAGIEAMPTFYPSALSELSTIQDIYRGGSARAALAAEARRQNTAGLFGNIFGTQGS
jgi:hypothetical protein